MTKSLTSENLHEVFSYPFQDPKWLEKFLVGSLLFLASILFLPTFLLYGYLAEVMRMAIEGKELALPAWDNWEKKFTDGAKLFIVGLIASSPFIILFILGYLFMFAGVVGTDLVDFSSDVTSPFWAILPMLGSFGGLALFGLSTILGLIVGLLVSVIIAHVVATDDLSAAFRIKEWWEIFKANTSGFIITYLLVFGLMTAVNIVSQILYMTIIGCCIVPFLLFPAMFYIMIMISVLFGQAYKEGVLNLQT
jgi:hypothetical protein